MLYGYPNTQRINIRNPDPDGPIVSMIAGDPGNGDKIQAVQSEASYMATDYSVRGLWIEVPDGTIAGAVWSGDEWVNPEPGPSPGVGRRMIPKALFVLRIPFNKLVAIRASQEPAVITWLYVLDMLVDIDLNDPNTAAGLDMLIALNLINEDDKAAALA